MTNITRTRLAVISAQALLTAYLGYNALIFLAILAGGKMELDAFTRVLVWPLLKLLG